MGALNSRRTLQGPVSGLEILVVVWFFLKYNILKLGIKPVKKMLATFLTEGTKNEVVSVKPDITNLKHIRRIKIHELFFLQYLG